MTDAAASPIDRQILAALEADTSRELLPELIKVFTTTADGRIARIAELKEEGNLAAIAAEAHALKSSAATFGATEVRRISAELEVSGKAGERNTALSLADALVTAVDKAKTALAAYVEEIST